MSFEQKYLKYKAKYLALKNGGHYLHEHYFIIQKMPQICFGTAQINLKVTLPLALRSGYRHIDGAECYGGSDYKKIVRDAIKAIPRDQLWITWKDDGISLEKIRRICAELDCKYIDLFLVHHSCGKESDFVEFKKAQAADLIRYYGVSNCENLETIRRLKAEHNIFANQIQARTPRGRVSGRHLFNPPNFIEECNRLGVNTMLFGTISGITNLDDYSIIYNDIVNVNKYYIQRYLLENNNVLIVSSISGGSIPQNLIDMNNIISGRERLTAAKMQEIETNLETLTLNHQ
jgi:diketogulonate reductase-like aldo/keto reductase